MPTVVRVCKCIINSHPVTHSIVDIEHLRYLTPVMILPEIEEVSVPDADCTALNNMNNLLVY